MCSPTASYTRSWPVFGWQCRVPMPFRCTPLYRDMVAPNSYVDGFDTFTGLPEPWLNGKGGVYYKVHPNGGHNPCTRVLLRAATSHPAHAPDTERRVLLGSSRARSYSPCPRTSTLAYWALQRDAATLHQTGGRGDQACG